MDLIIDAIRWILWLLCKGCFFIMDSVYNILKPIIVFDIAGVDLVWNWFTILSSLIGFFIIWRIASMTLKYFMDEDYLQKKDPLKIIIRIGVIAIVVVAFPFVMKYTSSVASSMIDELIYMMNSEDVIINEKYYTGDEEKDKEIEEIYKAYNGMPSQILVTSASNGTYPPYPLIDINETEGGLDSWFDGVPVVGGLFNITSGLFGADGDYTYFPDTTMIIFLCVEALMGVYMFILMVIQISMRIYNIGFKILIAPIPISGLVNDEDKSFAIWVRLIGADMLSNVLQYLLLIFVLAVTSSEAVQSFGLVGRAIFFLGGMLAVIIGPNSVAQIIGGDGMGVFQTLQGFQTMGAMKNITDKALGGLGAIGAASIYGAGRLLGGKSLGQPSSDGGASDFLNGGSGGGPDGGSGPSGLGKSFSKTPTPKQVAKAHQLGIENPEQMSRGQLSLALQNAGMDESYWNGYNGGASGTIASSAGNYSQSNAGMDVSHGEGAGSTSSQGSNEVRGNPSQENVVASSLTREGSIASKVSARGKDNVAYRGLATAGRALYVASGNRIMGTKTVNRGGKYIQKSTKPQMLSNIKHGIHDVIKGGNDPISISKNENVQVASHVGLHDRESFNEEGNDE